MQEERTEQLTRRGRRAGQSTTREEIRAVAYQQFAHHGYGSTSLRRVAVEAGVDPSLVTHYFKTKEGLFSAVFDVIDTLPAQLADAARDPGTGRGRRLASLYLGAWEDPQSGPRLRALARAASDSPAAAALVRRTLEEAVIADLADVKPSGVVRIQAALAQLLGVALARHALAVAPFASLTLEQVLDLVAPAVDATLSVD